MTAFTPLHAFEHQDVAGLLEMRARLSPDAPFLTWLPFEGGGRTWTYGAFAEDVSRVAGGLLARGVGRGQRVAVFLDNCPECLLTWFACAWMGAVCIPVNSAWTTDELSYALELAEVVGIVTQPRLLAVAAAAAGSSRWVVSTDTDAGVPATGDDASHAPFDALRSDPVARHPVDAAAPCCVMFTSGTTSRPKGVVWTQTNVLWAARLGAMQEGLTQADRHLVFLPLFHVVALTWSVLPAMWVGASVVLQPRFSASRFWEAAVAERCTFASMVPFCTAVLARQPVPERHSFRAWGHAVYLPAHEARFGLKLLGWWGMTEIVTQGIVGDLALPQSPGTIGRPSLGYDIVVLDESGEPSARGETGELRIRGERGVSLFLEYLNDAQATRDAFDENGYFRTGDRVVVRPDGAIAFVERAKDVIKVGGENVSASEVERIVLSVAGIREAAVVALADPTFGEVPVAFVTVESSLGAEALAACEERVIAACRERLAKFKVPRRVIVIAEMPRVSIAKISKPKLKAMLT